VTRSGRFTSICILARYPRLGEVKTRLVGDMSEADVLALHGDLVRHTALTARALVATREARAQLRTDAAFPRAAREWLGMRDLTYRYQGEGDLGNRIELAFAEQFGLGAERVVVIGADCPRLSATHLRDALARLDHADVVLGPAIDGGYYLVALRRESATRSTPALFHDIEWSTDNVLAHTLDRAAEAGLSCELLEPLPDVDRPEDVADARDALARGAIDPAAVRVSVVIPALEDAALVGAAVESAISAGAAEVLVADGGSRDATREVATAAGARVIASEPGRASQMNAGAAQATGDVLLFLHADTTLPPGACALAAEALARPGVVGGGFGYSVTADARHGALISASGRVRPSLGGPPWGDQAQFVSRDTFFELGGFPDLPVMEDWEFIHRLRRFGRVVTLPQRVITSARTWEEFGLIFPTALNIAVIGAYRMGVDPHRIARWRRRIAPAARR
jgi:rSAM/selenodomain-associated transferase 2/rSAM/selenodomain-associated transferase 1